MRVTRRLGGGIVVAVVTLGVTGIANADEPVAAREPQLMTETAEVTSVVDAFDRDDPFDLNLLGWALTSEMEEREDPPRN